MHLIIFTISFRWFGVRQTMIKLEGIVLNVFTQQGGKDKKTGDQFADRDKVQILGAMDLPNGDVKMNFLRYQSKTIRTLATC